MYEAAEDSELLAAVVQKLATGTVLDLGTGSGILAQTAHDKGLSVTAVDIDRSVVRALANKPFTVFHSDRFSKVKGTFDTIVCNPPYLPADDAGEDARLYGGEKGYEYIVQVLTEAKLHLAVNGQFLFLISTLTKPAVVEKALLQEGYAWSIVAREKLFMEELLVYRATFRLGEPAQYIGKGKRSVVYRTAKSAVKCSTPLRATKEAQLLKKVNAAGIGPRLHKQVEDKLYMEYIAGEPFDIYIKRTDDISVYRKLLAQARTLDKIGIKKQELHRPGKNVLVTARKRVVLLDFERSIFTERPNNVTALGVWISRRRKKTAQTALAAYKRTYSDSAFRQVLKELLT
jgi:HemK-related putative methylase